MADTKPTGHRTRFLRRMLLSLLAVAAIAALAVTITARYAAPEYRRYVGSPLPDGSRVTFLYPSHLNPFPLNKSVISSSVVQDEQLVKPLSLRELLLLRSPFWGRISLADDLAVGVVVTDRMKLPDAPLGTAAGGRFEQQSVGSINNVPSSVAIDSVYLYDAKSKLSFNFEHQYLASSTPSPAFVKREAMITNSFQVLPPGAAVPVP